MNNTTRARLLQGNIKTRITHFFLPAWLFLYCCFLRETSCGRRPRAVSQLECVAVNHIHSLCMVMQWFMGRWKRVCFCLIRRFSSTLALCQSFIPQKQKFRVFFSVGFRSCFYIWTVFRFRDSTFYILTQMKWMTGPSCDDPLDQKNKKSLRGKTQSAKCFSWTSKSTARSRKL